jgi:GxxExxY protein
MLIREQLTEQIIGVYYEVYRELGYGFLEKVCQRAMVIALTEAGLVVAERVRFPVFFRRQLLGDFISDIVVNGVVLVEIKAASALHAWDDAQALNYLHASPLEVALIMNFGPKREYRRRILSKDHTSRKSSVPDRLKWVDDVRG